MTARGVFLSFEGGEGSGKSTQISILTKTLELAGLQVVLAREPGGTRLGEAVRALLLDPATGDVDSRAELLLYEASRAQLTREIIQPALATGAVVLCDRYYDSSTAYQGYGRGLPISEIEALNSSATGGLVPDMTLLLDGDHQRGMDRATTEGTDRLEAAGDEFHSRVRHGFLRIAEAEPLRVKVIDAEGTPEQVALRVLASVRTIPVLALVLSEAGL
ncbi:MAG: dTMP kinase [Actinomycetota bacterium]|nr:dTMP kinase [Actinomycetota bacterium]